MGLCLTKLEILKNNFPCTRKFRNDRSNWQSQTNAARSRILFVATSWMILEEFQNHEKLRIMASKLIIKNYLKYAVFLHLMGCFLVVILMHRKNEFSERYPIIIVTHSMKQAARVSQRTASFRLGEIIE